MPSEILDRTLLDEEVPAAAEKIDTSPPEVQPKSQPQTLPNVPFIANMYNSRRPHKVHLRILQSTSPLSLPNVTHSPHLPCLLHLNSCADKQNTTNLTAKPSHSNARYLIQRVRADVLAQPDRCTTQIAFTPQGANPLLPRGMPARNKYAYMNRIARVQILLLTPHMESYSHIRYLIATATAMGLPRLLHNGVEMVGC